MKVSGFVALKWSLLDLQKSLHLLFMNTTEPNRRYQTKKARAVIIEKFNWRNEDWMQDWPLEVSNEIDLAFCLREYPKLADDEKFLLMEGILYALDGVQGADFDPYSIKVVELLKTDFDIHKFTIYYWTLYRDYPDKSEGFMITPLMRDIWNSQQKV